MKRGSDVIINEDHFLKVAKDCDQCSIGYRVAIDKGFYCTTHIHLGDYVHISPYVTCIGGKGGEFSAEGFNNIMAGARIVCVSDRFDDSGLFGALIPDEFKGRQMGSTVRMEKFSNIGTNAIMLPGSTLREGCLLTAGSLLMGDTVAWGVYKGNPAQLEKILDRSIIKQKHRELINKDGYNKALRS